MMKITSIQYTDVYGTPQEHRVGVDPTIEKIEHHEASGYGDKWYYDVYFKSGKMKRIFDPSNVMYDSISHDCECGEWTRGNGLFCPSCGGTRPKDA